MNKRKTHSVIITSGVGKRMPEPFATANPLNCSKCGIPATQDEKQEWDHVVKDNKESVLCRKCIARIDRIIKFREHLKDDEYWVNGEYTEEWEWHAWRITEDFEDSAILQRDLRHMMDEKLTVNDYNKIIEVLAMMMLNYKYTGETQELPR
jgi:hypothetical protein